MKRYYWFNAAGVRRWSTDINDMPPVARSIHEYEKRKRAAKLRKVRREREARALELRAKDKG